MSDWTFDVDAALLQLREGIFTPAKAANAANPAKAGGGEVGRISRISGVSDFSEGLCPSHATPPDPAAEALATLPTCEEVTTWPLSEVDRRRLRLKIRSRLLGCDLWMVPPGDPGPSDGLPVYTTDEVRELLKLTPEDVPAKVQAVHLAKLSFGPVATVEEVIPA